MKVREVYDKLKTIESLYKKVLSIIVYDTPIDKALSRSDIFELRKVLAKDIYELKEREIKNA